MARSVVVISHWHHRADDFNTSSHDFYDAVKKELEEIKAPVGFDHIEWSESGVLSAKRSYLRVEFNRLAFDICAAPFGRSFFFSWWLAERSPRVAGLYGLLLFIGGPILLYASIAVAGFFRGIFLFVLVSAIGGLAASSLIKSSIPSIEDTVLAIPVIGRVYAWFFKPATYYAIDSRIIFEETVHDTVLKIVDALLAAKGARALAPEDRKPKPGGLSR